MKPFGTARVRPLAAFLLRRFVPHRLEDGNLQRKKKEVMNGLGAALLSLTTYHSRGRVFLFLGREEFLDSFILLAFKRDVLNNFVTSLAGKGNESKRSLWW